ncbi:MAG: nucleotidyltransferase domain-containing protein [Spirochaetales bacterium]|nr:nucleotidyltransferase domain-containing protein [Spirochaetales bacterium]
MYPHHQETINRVTQKLKADPHTQALIIAGSIAHGFALPGSDVDILVVVSEQEYEVRKKENRLLYWEKESASYESGYVDGKYITLDFIKNLSPGGSEPEKFAFTDVYAAFSHVPELDELIKKACEYPVQYKNARIRRLYARFNEWVYFYEESRKKSDRYLETKAIVNLIHYGCRALLAYNERLYPFHKWMLRVLETAPDKPQGIMALIQACLDSREESQIRAFIQMINDFTDWGFPYKDWVKVLTANEELGCWDSDW